MSHLSRLKGSRSHLIHLDPEKSWLGFVKIQTYSEAGHARVPCPTKE